MNFLLRIVISGVVAFGLSYILSGIHIDNFLTALVLALVLGVLNAIIKPILVILTLPITIITFGLFLFVINACMILLASKFVSGFRVDGFLVGFAVQPAVIRSYLTALHKQPGCSKKAGS